MLGTTLWIVIAIGLLATALLDAGAMLARASVHAGADHAVENAMHDALAAYQNRLGAAVAADDPADAQAGYGVALASMPNPFAGTSAPADGGAPPVSYAVVPTTVVAPVCSDAPAPAAAGDVVAWLQCGGDIAESRVSLRVDVRVLDPGGAVLAQRTQYVTLRLFAQPPYSAIVGAMDGDADAPASIGGAPPAHEGDVGGDTVSGVQPAPAASAWPAGGTLIHVRFECHDGAGSCANAAPPDPDGALRANARWQNGNAPPP